MFDRHAPHRIEGWNAAEQRRQVFVWMAQSADRLREDVEGKFITRMHERRIAIGVPCLQRHRPAAHAR